MDRLIFDRFSLFLNIYAAQCIDLCTVFVVQLKQREAAYKAVVQEAKKVHGAAQDTQATVEKHKERNRRLEEVLREAASEHEGAKKQIDEKENEVRNLNRQMQAMTQVPHLVLLTVN